MQAPAQVVLSLDPLSRIQELNQEAATASQSGPEARLRLAQRPPVRHGSLSGSI